MGSARTPNTATPAFGRWCAAAIFLGAWLLFQIQPVIGKMILPWFGGSPAVWTTCLLFFQILLLAGYAYADLLARWRDPLRQALVHGALLGLALATLPITPGAAWKPPDGTHPVGRILLLLTVSVGLPYVLLSATSPLLQTWFARVYPGRSPYRLYALSNIGSLGALLSYPFVVEPALTTGQQDLLWSAAFSVFVVGCGALAWGLWRARRPAVERPVARPILRGDRAAGPDSPADTAPLPAAKVSGRDRLAWLLLPALASLLLMAVTNHVCQDVAVVPFLWIAPLTLYLLSFIICFDREAWYVRRWFALGAMLAVLAASYLMLSAYADRFFRELGWSWPLADLRYSVRVPVAVYLTLLFLVCMVCHGEVVRRKPAASRLTSFYLTVAAGGALGGLLVAVVCPRLWSAFLELNVGLVAAFVLSLGVLVADGYRPWFRRLSVVSRGTGVVFGVVLLAIVLWAQWESWDREGGLVRRRNFYGVLAVRERFPNEPALRGLALYHGAILHGYQFLAEDKRRQPTTYFTEHSGVGCALRCRQPRGPVRIGIVGLGAGTLAAYARAGDYFRFYEINPLVIELAYDPFTFLAQSPARIDVVPGDARLSLEQELERGARQQFDVLVLDAFSGDTIPVHLLTREAFLVYAQHLKPDGLIAAHISNRYVDLVPVVAEIAHREQLAAALISQTELRDLEFAPSDWMLLSRDPAFLRQPTIQPVAQTPRRADSFPVWTDQYSNLFQILRSD